MFPEEEFLLKALKETDGRIIVLLKELGSLYVTYKNQNPDDLGFDSHLQVDRLIQKCANDIADLKEKSK